MPPSSRQPSSAAKVGQKGRNDKNRLLSEVPHTVKITLLGLTGIQYNQGWKNYDSQSEKGKKSQTNANATCYPPEKTRAIVNFARSNKQKLGTSPLSGLLQLSHRHKVSVLRNKDTLEKQKKADEDVEVEIANEATSTDLNLQRYVAVWDSQKGEGNQTLPLVSFETTLSKSSDSDSSSSSKSNFAPKSFQVMVGLAPDQNTNFAFPIGMASLTIRGDELPKVRDGQVITREIDLPLLSLEQATPQFETGNSRHPVNDSPDLIYFVGKKPQQTDGKTVPSKSLDPVPEQKKKKKKVRFGMFSKSKKTKNEKKNGQSTGEETSSSLDRDSFNSQYTVDSEGEGILRVAIEVYDKSTNDEKRIQFQRLKQKLNEESALSKRSQKTEETESDVFSDATRDTDIMNNLNETTKKLFDSIRETSGLNSINSNQTKTTTNVSLVDHSDSEDENDKKSLESVVSCSSDGSASDTHCTNSTNGTHTTNDGSISYQTDDVSVLDTVGSSYRSIDADESSSDEEYNENNRSGSDHDESTVARGTGKRMTKFEDLFTCTNVSWKDRVAEHTTCGEMDQVDFVSSASDVDGTVSVIKMSDSPQGVEEVNSPSPTHDGMTTNSIKDNSTPKSLQAKMMNMFTCGASADEVDDDADLYSPQRVASSRRGSNQSYDENDPPRVIEQIASWRSVGTYLTETSFEEHERQRNERREARREAKRQIVKREVEKTHFTNLPLPAAFGGSGLFVKAPKAMTHKERDERDRLAEEALDDFTLTQTFTEDDTTLGGTSYLDVNSKSQ